MSLKKHIPISVYALLALSVHAAHAGFAGIAPLTSAEPTASSASSSFVLMVNATGEPSIASHSASTSVGGLTLGQSGATGYERHEGQTCGIHARGKGFFLDAVSAWTETNRVSAPVQALMPQTQPGGTGTEVGPNVLEIPPPPSSLMLGLTALAGLGVSRAGRSVMNLQYASLPSWYHAEVTKQIGASTPLDIESWTLPICILEEPQSVQVVPAWYCKGAPPRLLLPPVCTWPPSAARAPPHSS